jgi:hypothetical protein
MEVTRIPRRRARVKHHGLTLRRPRLMTKLNLLKEEALAKVTTKRKNLIRVRCSVIIVRSMVILLMNVGSRKINKMRVRLMWLKVEIQMQC